jgi:hypothetical protein
MPADDYQPQFCLPRALLVGILTHVRVLHCCCDAPVMGVKACAARAQLACARIGAVHSVVFAGFSAESLSGRILDSRPRVVLTASAVKRGAKPISLKARVG